MTDYEGETMHSQASCLILVGAILLFMSGCLSQSAAIKCLESRGATVSVDWTSVEFYNDELSDGDVKSLAWALRAVGSDYIGLNQTAITDQALTYLTKMDSLRTLSVTGTAVTPDGVDKLVRVAPSLELVVLPDHWDKDPELASQLASLIAQYPTKKFLLGHRDGAVVESRPPLLRDEP